MAGVQESPSGAIPDVRDECEKGEGGGQQVRRKRLRFANAHYSQPQAVTRSLVRKDSTKPAGLRPIMKALEGRTAGAVWYEVDFTEEIKTPGERKKPPRRRKYIHRCEDELRFRRDWERALDRLVAEGPVRVNGCALRGTDERERER